MFALKRSRAGMDAEHEPGPRAGKRRETIFGEGAATIAGFGDRASSPKMVSQATAARQRRGSEDDRRIRSTGRTTNTESADLPSDHAEPGLLAKRSDFFGLPSVADNAFHQTSSDLPRLLFRVCRSETRYTHVVVWRRKTRSTQLVVRRRTRSTHLVGSAYVNSTPREFLVDSTRRVAPSVVDSCRRFCIRKFDSTQQQGDVSNHSTRPQREL